MMDCKLNGLRLAAGSDVTHVGAEEGTVIASPFKIRKPARYLGGRRNTGIDTLLC